MLTWRLQLTQVLQSTQFKMANRSKSVSTYRRSFVCLRHEQNDLDCVYTNIQQTYQPQPYCSRRLSSHVILFLYISQNCGSLHPGHPFHGLRAILCKSVKRLHCFSSQDTWRFRFSCFIFYFYTWWSVKFWWCKFLFLFFLNRTTTLFVKDVRKNFFWRL